jgi:hypothetical protein
VVRVCDLDALPGDVGRLDAQRGGPVEVGGDVVDEDGAMRLHAEALQGGLEDARVRLGHSDVAREDHEVGRLLEPVDAHHLLRLA